MKNSTKILIALTSLVFLGACQQKAVYTTSSFVRLGSTSVRVNEDTGTVSIPVYAYASNGSVAFRGAGAEATSTNVAFELVDGTAVSGTDYELVEPAGGLLTFQGDSIQYITVRIIERPNETTGNLSFSVKLSSATNGYTIGGTSTATVSILDLDQEGDDLLGTYTATGESYYDGAVTWTVTFSQGSNSNERLIDGLVNGMSYYDSLNGLYGTLSADRLSFTIDLPYWFNVRTSLTDGTTVYLAYILWDESDLDTSSSQTLTFTYEAGQWTSDNGIAIGLFTTNGDSSTYSGYVYDIINPTIVLEAQ